MPSSAVVHSTEIQKTPTKYVSKPDDENYKKQLDEIKNTIDKLQEDLSVVIENIKNTSDNASVSQKREELRSQLDRLRGKQAEIKKDRLKTHEQLKTMNDAILKKKRELKASKDKLQFRTVKEINNQILNLEKQVESGTLKIVDERRIISEITNLKKSKKIVEACETLQNTIDADQRSIDELKKTLDDKDNKDINAEYEKVKMELDSINRDYDNDKEKRNELFEERKKLRDQITYQISTRKAIHEQHNKAKQEYRKKVDEDRRRRFELKQKQQEEYEEQKKSEKAAQKLADASIPAFQDKIIICEKLINYFQTHYGTGKPIQPIILTASVVDDNIRQPDATSNVPEGTILLKKSEREEDYFFGGGKSKKKSKTIKEKKSNKANGIQKIPISIMEELGFLEIAVPLNASEVEKTISELEKSKAYFVENQDQVTKENIAKAMAEISALENKKSNQQNKEVDVDHEESKVEEAQEDTRDVNETEEKLSEAVEKISTENTA
ncbi:9881_t:CDS:2 [Acaulospora morrowiae]|uniref:9881_t:CDS:1 n=1 Tax=Acaulospora morrowiae TaxID=94023 RepID=A0A9N9DSS3_9GLOM|nr:9881_t:CDS:2 [Acaulospora morrowiae]